jgi:hypothetical protein
LHLLEDFDRDDVEAHPPLMRVRLTAMLLIVGVHKRRIVPTVLVEIGWSSSSKSILLEDHLSLGLFTFGCAAAISRDSCLKWQFDSGA